MLDGQDGERGEPAAHTFQGVLEQGAVRFIQVGGGFIQNQEFGGSDSRGGQVHQLLFAAAESGERLVR